MTIKTIEGKTKIVRPIVIAEVTSKDDITAGNGVRHDILPGKAKLSTNITCNIFTLLEQHGIRTAFIGRSDREDVFYTKLCDMIPIEVVVRAVAAGSYSERNLAVEKGVRLESLVVEFYYKTSGRKIGELELPCDDPLIIGKPGNDWQLYHPAKPIDEGHIGTLPLTAEKKAQLTCDLTFCHDVAKSVFTILEETFLRYHAVLQDLKLEFGILPGNRIVVADVIDPDSWRVVWQGKQISKQGYRDGDSLADVLESYKIADELVSKIVIK